MGGNERTPCSGWGRQDKGARRDILYEGIGGLIFYSDTTLITA